MYLISGPLVPTLLLNSPDLLVIEIGDVVDPTFDRAERGEVARTWSVPAVTGWLAEKKSMTPGARRAWLLGLWQRPTPGTPSSAASGSGLLSSVWESISASELGGECVVSPAEERSGS